MTQTNLTALSNSLTYNNDLLHLHTGTSNPSAAFVWANNGCSTVFSMAIKNLLPWVLSSFNKQAPIAEGQRVNYYYLPGRSSCKLASRSWLKYNVLPAPTSAVRNQLAGWDWKAENLKNVFSSCHDRCRKMKPHRFQQSKPCYWKKTFGGIPVVAWIQLYEMIFTERGI